MIRNCLKTLLCLVLALMLPLCAVADVQHTLKVTPGAALGLDEAITDLTDVLGLKLTQGGKSAALSVTLGQTDVATFAFSADATGLYLHSALLSDDVLYVTWDDGFAYLMELLKAQMRAEGVTDEQLAPIESSMAETKASIVKALGSGVEIVSAKPADGMAAITQAISSDPALMEIYGDVVVEKGDYAAAQRDAADEKRTLNLGTEQLLKFCDTDYMRTLARETAMLDQPQLQGEALEKTVDEMMEEVRALYSAMDSETQIVGYFQNGTEPVGMEVTMRMTVGEQEDGSASTMTAEANYDRLTDESGVAYKAAVNITLDGSAVMQSVFALHRGVDDVSEGSLAVLAGGEEITLLYHGQNTQPDVRQRKVELYERSGATAIIAPAASDRPLITFELTTAQADPAVLETVKKADAHNSVNVMKLSAEEMQTLVSQIQTRSMQSVYTALAELPTSTLQLLMQMAQ